MTRLWHFLLLSLYKSANESRVRSTLLVEYNFPKPGNFCKNMILIYLVQQTLKWLYTIIQGFRSSWSWPLQRTESQMITSRRESVKTATKRKNPNEARKGEVRWNRNDALKVTTNIQKYSVMKQSKGRTEASTRIIFYFPQNMCMWVQMEIRLNRVKMSSRRGDIIFACSARD